jgi:hypothetical protein
MMNGASATNAISKNGSKSALSIVILMLFSLFAGVISVQTVAATASGDLALSSPESPLEGGNYSRYDSIPMKIEVWNKDIVALSGARSLRWYACSGDHVASGCPNQGRSTGISSVAGIGEGEKVIITFPTPFYPDESETGIHTVEFLFAEFDSNDADDLIRFNFWIAEELFDIVMDEEHDMRPANLSFAIHEDEYVYNSNTSYPMYAKGISNNCLGCTFDVEMGWRLVDENGSIVAEDSTNISDFSEWGQQYFNRSLPNLSSPETGRFTLQIGVFNSNAEDANGNPSSDLNLFNDLAEFGVVFNNNIDLTIDRMYPAYKSDSLQYFYGNDSVAVEVVNNGNISSENTTLFLELFLNDSTPAELPWECSVPVLYPRQSHKCLFNLAIIGDFKLNASVTTIFSSGDDENGNDNWLYEQITVVAGDLLPSITLNHVSGVYDTGDIIEFVAQVDATAPLPLNYSWWLGIIPKGDDRILNLPASDLGMGQHEIQLRVVDALANVAINSRLVTIYNRTTLISEPVVNGEALTTSNAALQYHQELPRLSINYNLPRNISPLMLFEFDVISTDEDKPDPQTEDINLQLNISSLIPDSVPFDTLQILYLESFESGFWSELEFPDEFISYSQNLSDLSISSGGTFLLTGALPPIEVSAENILPTQLPGGHIRLDFEPTGDLDNVYFSGWKVMKRVNDRNLPMRHPDDSTEEQENEYEKLYFVTDLSYNEGVWFDPTPLDEGFCASYAIVPFDRQGITDWDKGNVSGWQGNGLPEMSCGDSIPPFSGVTGLSASYQYRNETKCYNDYQDWNMCYVVNVTWNWPSTTELLRFNLYRLEIQPNESMNFTFMAPLAVNLSGAAGKSGYWNETSFNGILPNHTFYYVLAPIDEVGNVNLQPGTVSASFTKVRIENDFWKYNQHIIPVPPPPEEPPYGVDYLGELKSWMDDSRFQTIGLTTLAIFVINLIALPILLQKRKKIKVKIAKQNPGFDEDELEDDLAGFFT